MPPSMSSTSVTYAQRNKRTADAEDLKPQSTGHAAHVDSRSTTSDVSRTSPQKKRKLSVPSQSQPTPSAVPPSSISIKPPFSTTSDYPTKSFVPPSSLRSSALPTPGASESRPSSSTPSPKKLTKRMLGRSRTEPSLGSTGHSPAKSSATGSPSRVDRTASLPSVLSPSVSPARPATGLSSARIPSPPLPHPPQHSASTSSIVSPAGSSRHNATRTYGGKSRTILVELPLPGANGQLSSQDLSQASLGGVDEEDEFHNRESYASLRSRWGVDNSEDDPYPPPLPRPTANSGKSLSRSGSMPTTPSPSKRSKGKGKEKEAIPQPLPNGMMNPLKSITELRSKGESRRFLDEIGYLFEGMKSDGGLGLRRSTALDICTKLCDADFLRKAKAADFFMQTWEVFVEAGCGKGEDKILDVLLVLFIALLSRDASVIADLATRVSVPSTLLSFLARPDPLRPLASSEKALQALELKKMGYAKAEVGMLHNILSTIKSSNIKGLSLEDTQISAHLLASHALAALPAPCLPSDEASDLLKALKNRLPRHNSIPSTTAGAKDQGLREPGVVVNLLRGLDSYLLGQWSPSQSQSQQTESDEDGVLEELLELSGGLVNVCCLRVGSDGDAEPEVEEECIDLTYRSLVSLTNADPKCCDRLLEELAANEGERFSCILRSLQDLDRKSRASGATRVRGSNRALKKSEEEEEEEEETEVEEEEDAEAEAVARALDRLCLVLGLLTNLVQSGGAKSSELFTRRQIPTCDHAFSPRKSDGCDEACEEQKASAVEILAQLYASRLTSSSVKPEPGTAGEEAAADAFVVLGHLAILLGMLIRTVPSSPINAGTHDDIERAIFSAIPGPNRRLKLERMAQQARDVGQFYEAITSASQGTEGQDSERVGRGSGGAVTRDVIRFLEELKDRR